MNKMLLLLVLLLIVTTVGCAGGDAPAAGTVPSEVKTFTLRVQTVNAPAESAIFHRPALDAIEVASGGRLKFELYTAGEIVPDDQTISAVRAGTLDMIHTFSGSTAYPLDIFTSGAIGGYAPFAWNSPMELATMITHRGLEEVLIEAFEELGVVYVATHSTDPMHIMSTRPIETIDDFRGLKISMDPISAHPFLPLGAASVSVPTEEFYLAGTTGVVDALGWCGATEGVNNGWNEAFPYLLGNQISGSALCHWVANPESWNALPDDLQELIITGLRALWLDTMLYYYSVEALNREHYTVTYLPDEEWEQIVRDHFAYWDEIAQVSPRSARIVQIYQDYHAEVEKAGWWR